MAKKASKVKTKKKYKKIQVTLEFTASEAYPDDDFGSLHQNTFSLLNNALVSDSLMNKLKHLSKAKSKKISKVAYDAFGEYLDEKTRIGQEMVNSMKVKILKDEK